MSSSEGFRSAAWQINSGAGRQVEVDVDASGRFWAVVGPTVSPTDLWLTSAVAGVDLRLRIQRAEDGFTVSFDRREGEGEWWREDSSPTIIFRVEERGPLRITARAGGETAEIDLGSIAL